MTESIYAVRSVNGDGNQKSDEIMSLLLHGFRVGEVRYTRGRGSCIPYTAKIATDPPRPVFVPSFGDWGQP